MNISPSTEEEIRKAPRVRFIEKVIRFISVLFALGALAGLLMIFSDSGFQHMKTLLGFFGVFIGFGSYAIYRSKEKRG